MEDAKTPKSGKDKKAKKEKSSKKKSSKKEKKRARDDEPVVATTPVTGKVESKADVKVDAKVDVKADAKSASAKKAKTERVQVPFPRAVRSGDSHKRAQHAPRFFPLNPIANPLASDELATEVFGLLAQAVKGNKVRRGVKVRSLRPGACGARARSVLTARSQEATKFVRKGEKGIMVFAGDVEPLDVMSHMPVLCEDNDVPYVYVRSREELGMHAGLKRPTTCILIKSDGAYESAFNKLKGKIPVAMPTY